MASMTAPPTASIFFMIVFSGFLGCDNSGNKANQSFQRHSNNSQFSTILEDSVGIKDVVLGKSLQEFSDLINKKSCGTGLYEVGFSCWSVDKEISVAGISCKLSELNFWNGSTGSDDSYLTRAEFQCPAGVEDIIAAVTKKYGPNFMISDDEEIEQRSWRWDFPSGAHLIVWEESTNATNDNFTVVLSAGLWGKQMALQQELKLKDI